MRGRTESECGQGQHGLPASTKRTSVEKAGWVPVNWGLLAMRVSNILPPGDACKHVNLAPRQPSSARTGRAQHARAVAAHVRAVYQPGTASPQTHAGHKRRGNPRAAMPYFDLQIAQEKKRKKQKQQPFFGSAEVVEEKKKTKTTICSFFITNFRTLVNSPLSCGTT
jgi:hypothetical protein